jgi:hypothetical protein
MVGKNAVNSDKVISLMKSRIIAMISNKNPSIEVRQLVKILFFICFALIGLKEMFEYHLSSLLSLYCGLRMWL